MFGPVGRDAYFFDDKALESRFLTEEMGQYRLRDDVLINLPYVERELHIRKLCLRFRNLNKRIPAEVHRPQY